MLKAFTVDCRMLPRSVAQQEHAVWPGKANALRGSAHLQALRFRSNCERSFHACFTRALLSLGVCSETSVHRLELTLAHLVLEVVKCLWLGLDELSPEQRHRSRFTLQTLRCANASDRAAVIPALVDAGEQLALMHKALAATGCYGSARKVRAVLQSLTERLEQERAKVIRCPCTSLRPSTRGAQSSEGRVLRFSEGRVLRFS